MGEDALAFWLNQTTHSEEWERMWAELAALSLNGGDRVCECRTTGEMWEYMGTQKTTDGSWVHYFRHRDHPKTHRRETGLILANLEVRSD